MKTLLEDLSKDELRNVLFIQYLLVTLVFCMFIFVRSQDMSFFRLNFYGELIFLFFTFRFYKRAHLNKNYAFWGLTIIIALYLLKNILQFTFVDYNIVVLYLAILCAIFLGLNSYVMSSPLYYPRIQWWEYDFRYRGELKGTLTSEGSTYELRLTDFRRGAMSVLVFESIKIGSKVLIEIPYGSELFKVNAEVKTIRQIIPGRPLCYGVVIKSEGEEQKQSLKNLSRFWALHKKAVLRRKFSDYREEHENK